MEIIQFTFGIQIIKFDPEGLYQLMEDAICCQIFQNVIWLLGECSGSQRRNIWCNFMNSYVCNSISSTDPLIFAKLTCAISWQAQGTPSWLITCSPWPKTLHHILRILQWRSGHTWRIYSVLQPCHDCLIDRINAFWMWQIGTFPNSKSIALTSRSSWSTYKYAP